MDKQTEEENPKKKQGSIMTKLISIALVLIVLMSLTILSSIIDTGEKLASIHISLSWVYYLLLAGITYWFGMRPLFQVLSQKTRDWGALLSDESKPDEKWVQKQAQFLLKNANLDEEQIRKLEYNLTFKKDLAPCLREILQDKSESMDKVILTKARIAFLAVSVSQNGPLDALLLLSINLTLVRDVVRELGIRPSLTDLVKIYALVGVGAIAVDQLSDLDVGDAMSAIGSIAGKSAMQGLGATVITLRVGYLAKAYLMNGDSPSHKKEARKWARMNLVKVVSSGVSELPKNIAKKFESIIPTIDFGELVKLPQRLGANKQKENL